MVHDWTIGNRNAYTSEAPQRGDIINFYQAEEDTIMVKRVIGLPGETVSFVNDHVYIDGEPLDESAYLADDVLTECDETFTVPEGCVFLLGGKDVSPLCVVCLVSHQHKLAIFRILVLHKIDAENLILCNLVVTHKIDQHRSWCALL